MKPIQAGDHAEIIEGALGTKGPNVGKTVLVIALRVEHSELGRIWKVQGEGLITEYGAVGTTVDCAQSWLRKLIWIASTGLKRGIPNVCMSAKASAFCLREHRNSKRRVIPRFSCLMNPLVWGVQSPKCQKMTITVPLYPSQIIRTDSILCAQLATVHFSRPAGSNNSNSPTW